MRETIMSSKKERLVYLLVATSVSVFFFFAKLSLADTNFSVGLSYSKGYPSYPGFGFGGGAYYGGGYGAACGGYLAPPMPYIPPIAGGGCYTCAGGGGYYPGGPGGAFRPPMQTPAFPPLPPPAPMLPPHLAMPNMGWGPGFNSFPGPIVSGGACNPCGGGYMQQPIGPVPGGPAMYQSGMGLGYGPGGAGGWDDTSSIVWATALGLGMQTSNVYPLAIPRYDPTIIPPTWFGLGPRPSSITNRPHTDP